MSGYISLRASSRLLTNDDISCQVMPRQSLVLGPSDSTTEWLCDSPAVFKSMPDHGPARVRRSHSVMNAQSLQPPSDHRWDPPRCLPNYEILQPISSPQLWPLRLGRVVTIVALGLCATTLAWITGTKVHLILSSR